MTLPSNEIFKAYDIRGIVGKTLTAEIVEAIGHAIGSEAAARGQHAIAIGRDGRLSGPELAAALARGIRNSGINVIDVGCVATPMVYFAAYHLNTNCARDGHRQPQSARLQRPEDGAGRRDPVRRSHPGAAQPHRTRRICAHGAGSYARHDIAPEYHRAHRRRHQTGAADEASPSTAATAWRAPMPRKLYPRAGLRGAPNCSAKWTAISPTTIPTRPIRKPARPDRRAEAATTANSASPSTATATGWAWSPKTARSSTPTAS